MPTTNIISKIKSEFELHSNPSRAIKMAAYMKDKFPFYGVPSPVRKKIISAIWKSNKEEIKSNIIQLVKELWEEDQRELQYFAMDLMSKCEKLFDESHMNDFEHCIVNKSWWDTVDFLAANPVGYVLKGASKLQFQKSNEYIGSGNIWLQRTALLFQLKYKDEVDESLLYSNIKRLLGTREFFINKAIGWALRQYSKFNPYSVGHFIDNHRSDLSGLSIREGSKYL